MKQRYLTASSYSNLVPMRGRTARVTLAWWLGFGLYLRDGRLFAIRWPYGWWQRRAAALSANTHPNPSADRPPEEPTTPTTPTGIDYTMLHVDDEDGGTYTKVAGREAILATEPMQTLARDAAFVKMLERLVERADEIDISWDGAEWEVEWCGPDGHAGTGPTLRAAIAAALGDDDE